MVAELKRRGLSNPKRNVCDGLIKILKQSKFDFLPDHRCNDVMIQIPLASRQIFTALFPVGSTGRRRRGRACTVNIWAGMLLLLTITIAPVAGAPEVPPAAVQPAAAPTKRAEAAIAALSKLGAYVNADDWSVDLGSAKDVDAAIKLLPQLDHLYDVRFGETATDAQLAAVTGFKELRTFTLRFNGTVTDAGITALKSLTGLRNLALASLKNMTVAGTASITGLTSLESLDVSGNDLSEGRAAFLEKFPKLTKLDVGRTGLDDQGLAHLAGLKALRELQADFDDFTDAGMPHLAGLTRLERLELPSAAITDAGLKHLAGLTALTRLNIRSTGISDAGLSSLAAMTKLKYLNIGGTNVTGVGLKSLAGLKELESLELDDIVEFTGQGMDALAGCLKLQKIQLSWTGLTDDGLADVAKLQQATMLDLPPYGHATALGGGFWRDPHPERFSDKGLKHVGQMTNLEWLWFGGSGVTDTGLTHLAGLKKLKYLGLGDLPNIKGPGLASLRDMPNLTDLRLTNTGVTDEGLKSCSQLGQLKLLALPKTATPAALDSLQGLSGIETLYVPESWPDEAVAKAKKLRPKAAVSRGD